MIFQLNYEAEYAGLGVTPRIHYVRKKKIRPTVDQVLPRMKQCMKSRSTDFSEYMNNDIFLSRFLYTRKMNIETSVELLENYIFFRKTHPEIFENLVLRDPNVQMCLRNRFPGVLPNRDRNGRCVLFLSLNKWNKDLFPIESIYKSLLLLMDTLLNDSKIQYSGFVFLLDWNNIFMYINPKQLKIFIEGLQNCYPARFKAIHFINEPIQIDLILTLVKPFLKEKTRDKIFAHGNQLESIYEYLPKDILPKEIFGGEISLDACINSDVIVPPVPIGRKRVGIV